MSDVPPCPDPFNMAAHVLQWASRTPDKTALQVVGGDPQSWSFADLEDRVLRLAQGLLNAGFASGDAIFLRLGNRVETPITYLAAISVGILPVPVSRQLTAHELSRLAGIISPKALFSDTPAVALDGVRLILAEDMERLFAAKRAAYVSGDPDRPAYILITSGTSGAPRAVVHAHRAVWARQMMIRDWERIGPDDRLLHGGDFNWAYTMGTGLMDPWAAGATALIRAPETPDDALLDLLSGHDVTVFATDPGVLRRLARMPAIGLPHLRHTLTAGWALPHAIASAWQNASGAPVFEAFGQTEVSTFLSAGDTHALRPQNGRRIAILDDAGRPITDGATGMLAVHRSDPGLMIEYLGAPEATAAKYDGEWFLTGDLFEELPGGDLRFVARSDDLLNPGGYRVSPRDIEEALAPFPGLRDIAACTVEIKADTVVLAFAYTADVAIEETALAAFAEERLARYKQPRVYAQLDALPRSTNGKVIRKALPDLIMAAMAKT